MNEKIKSNQLEKRNKQLIGLQEIDDQTCDEDIYFKVTLISMVLQQQIFNDQINNEIMNRTILNNIQECGSLSITK